MLFHSLIKVFTMLKSCSLRLQTACRTCSISSISRYLSSQAAGTLEDETTPTQACSRREPVLLEHIHHQQKRTRRRVGNASTLRLRHSSMSAPYSQTTLKHTPDTFENVHTPVAAPRMHTDDLLRLHRSASDEGSLQHVHEFGLRIVREQAGVCL